MMHRIRIARGLLVVIAFFVTMANGFTPASSAMARRLRTRISYEAHVSKRMHTNKKKRNKIMAVNANDRKTTDADTDAKESEKCSTNTDKKGKCRRGCGGCAFNKPDRDLPAFPHFKDCE